MDTKGKIMARKFLIVMLLAGFVAPMLPHVTHACAVVMGMQRIGTRFRVKAVDRGAPVVGTEITLEREPAGCFREKPVASAVTDESGFAQFDKLPPGDYYLCVRSPLEGDVSFAWVRIAKCGDRRENCERNDGQCGPVFVSRAGGPGKVLAAHRR